MSLSQPEFIHLPGQWLDVHIPFISQAGGFTITSAPQRAVEALNGHKHLELAIQYSSKNPPAAFFWRAQNEILGTSLKVRVGGRFFYPPPELNEKEVNEIQRIVFVAGGVGINPIMSMLEHLHLESHLQPTRIRSLRLLYGTQAQKGEEILFYDRIGRMLHEYVKTGPAGTPADHDYRVTMYLTGDVNWSPDEVAGYESMKTDHIDHARQRITRSDLIEALGPLAGRKNTVAYVCGPPEMTDEFVEILSREAGMDSRRVLCEKWW